MTREEFLSELLRLYERVIKKCPHCKKHLAELRKAQGGKE